MNKREDGNKRQSCHEPVASKEKVSRRTFLKTAASASLATSALGGALASNAWGQSPAARPSATRPNVLFLTTDQQHLDSIAGLGAPRVKTPHFDRLAARGIAFTQSYCTNPLCSPSRSSWFTGRMPSETGIYANDIPATFGRMPSMGALMRDAGYDTYYAGKWHLMEPCSYYIPGFKTLIGGETSNEPVFDDMVSSCVQAFLMSRASATPFLLAVGLLQPHDACSYVGYRSRKFDEAPWDTPLPLPPLPPNYDAICEEEPAITKKLRTALSKTWGDMEWRRFRWAYERMIEQSDARVGRILDALEASGLDKNTLIVFTSDHGEGRGEHKLHAKNFLYESSTRVPFLISWPGQIAEGVKNTTRFVSGLDILPTILDYAGVKPPKVHGLSLRATAEGRRSAGHEFLISECQKQGRQVRTADFKYIEYANDPARQFFDLKNDPGETTNLAQEQQYAAAMTDHARLLRDWESRMEAAVEAKVEWGPA